MTWLHTRVDTHTHYADDGVIGHEDPEKVQALADAFTVWFK
jgi:hypothetical protein